MEEAVRWLTPSEMRAWLALRSVIRLVDTALDRDLRSRSGLSHDDFQILAQLSNALENRIRMSALAELVLISPSALTYRVNQLEKAGLVRREECQTDKRGALTALTTKGKELLRKIAPGHVACVRRLIFDQLSSEQVNRFGDTLEDIVGGLGRTDELHGAIERELTREESED